MVQNTVFKRIVHALLLFLFLTAVLLADDNQVVAKADSGNKLMTDTGIGLEMRVGTILWSGLSWPKGSASTNGINGKNFLYPTLPTFGFGTRFSIDHNIRFCPSLDLIFDEYVYRADLDRAFRTQNMTGNAVGPLATVTGILISVPVWFDFVIEKSMIFSLSSGLAFYPRLALVALDNSTGIDKITENLNREAKWLYPETGIAFYYAINTWMAVGLQGQMMYPIYHFWSTDGLPFYDSMIFTGIVSFDFFL